MKWEFEAWRKLYTRITPEWAALPALCRGLGSELLKYADDEGRIHLGDQSSASQEIVRLISAHRSEARLVRAHVARLIADGFLVEEPGCLRIRNLKEAQTRMSSAARSARYRARQRHASRDVSRDAKVTQNDTRSEIEIDHPLPRKAGDLFFEGGPTGDPTPRESGTNPRATDTNPRALGSNPRATGRPRSGAPVQPSPPRWAKGEQ